MELVIIDYGAGNIKSLEFAFKRLGVNAILSKDAETIFKAEKVIFPGVGHANAALEKLKETGLDKLIPELKQPVLGICLGMQLLCANSEEGNTRGLSVFNTNVKRFDNGLKVPQMGWNSIEALRSPLFKNIDEGSFMYSVHSYYAEYNDQAIATTEYGLEYASALAKDNFFGVQFHPEKSGAQGKQILKNFLDI